RGSVAARPSSARRGGHRPRHPSEQPDRRLSVHAGHGDHLVQQPMLLGSPRLLVPLPLHGGVLAQAGSRHGGLHGRIGNRDFRSTSFSLVTEILCRWASLPSWWGGGGVRRGWVCVGWGWGCS